LISPSGDRVALRVHVAAAACALRASALDSGCSLNQFAIQVLASAAGHRARFRGIAETGPTRVDSA